MDVGYKLKLENPKQNANFMSKLVFGWVMRLLYKGTTKGIEVIDLYKALDSDKSKKLGDELEHNWNNEIHRAKSKNVKPSLMRALSKTFLIGYMMWGLLFFLQMVVFRSIQPIVLSYLIALFIEPQSENNSSEMYACSALVVGVNTCTIFLLHHANFGFASVGMRIRIALSSVLYRKITRLNQKSLGKTAAGQVVNLLSNDVNRFDLVILALHCLWVMPIQVVVISYFLWQQVGISCLAGLMTMLVISLPFQDASKESIGVMLLQEDDESTPRPVAYISRSLSKSEKNYLVMKLEALAFVWVLGYLGKLTGQLRSKIAYKTDKRVKLMSEIISGMQVIKMYAWEKPFEKMVEMARATEIKDLTTTSYVRGIFSSCHIFIQRSTLFLTIICFVLLGNNLTADVVFTVAQFYSILQLSLAILYPMAISLGAEAWISVKRLQEFMLLEERISTDVEKLKEPAVDFNSVSACWTDTDETLRDISLHIPPGTLCAVVGPVGAGKSSLLQVLLGELAVKSGTIAMGGQISYSSQEPWLFHSTVRSNILFGQPYNKSWYRKVVKVCALEKDFKLFPQKDKTIVGERGVSLSGGQRARINLARAIYRQADVYLLDDPFSAVDTRVGKFLFDECVIKHLLGKTRILVTHQLQYLKKADLIVVINDGRIEAQGTFEALSNSNLDFTNILVAANESDEITEYEKLIDHEETETARVSRKESILSISNSFFTDSIDFVHHNPEEETKSDSSISPLWEYIKATQSWILVTIVVVLLILAQSASAGADYWVAFWTDQEHMRNSNDSMILGSQHRTDITKVEVHSVGGNIISPYTYTYSTDVENSTARGGFSFEDLFDTIEFENTAHKILKTNCSMYIYGALVVAAILLTLTRSLLFFKLCMQASKNLHSNMFHVLLKAPMHFFDTNPSGRILNRFSKDMGAIDEILSKVLMDAIQITGIMFGILVNVGVSNPYMIIAMVLVGSVFWKIRCWYISSAKVLKHIEGATKSPVFSHITSTLSGIPTIRAAQAEKILISQFDDHQDIHTSAWFLTIACVTFFGIWLDIICLVFIACVTFSFVILHSYSAVAGSFVGLAISQSLDLSGMLQHGIRRTTDVINELISVERVLQYTTIESEHSLNKHEESSPPPSWPCMGQIEFCNLSLRYVADETSILKNLNFTVQPGEKIGIVGRTGAGKSSLISALFRLAPIDGSIFIDGLDTKKLKLLDLRRAISIIPQEPVLFAATMRYNLDPFNQFDDFRLWKALEEVELKDAIDSLNCMVSEGGSNFSLGQRQLLCLARAILRNNKIFIMDEATANVDLRTDSLIQTTIRKKFKDCTVLTIAHRLNTIMDSDKVLVMSSGNMVEFDHPHKLLENPEGYFYKMVHETGQVMSMQLKDIALEAYNEKKHN